MIRFRKNIRPEAKTAARKIAIEYGIVDQGGLNLLQTFAAAMTTELDCQDAVDSEGLTTVDRFGQTRNHPLLTIITSARAQKLACLKALNLDLEPMKTVGRPGG